MGSEGNPWFVPACREGKSREGGGDRRLGGGELEKRRAPRKMLSGRICVGWGGGGPRDLARCGGGNKGGTEWAKKREPEEKPTKKRDGGGRDKRGGDSYSKGNTRKRKNSKRRGASGDRIPHNILNKWGRELNPVPGQ